MYIYIYSIYIMHVGDSYPKSHKVFSIWTFRNLQSYIAWCADRCQGICTTPLGVQNVKGGLRRSRLHVGFWSVWSNPNDKQSRTTLDVFRCSKCSLVMICGCIIPFFMIIRSSQCGWTRALDFRQCVSPLIILDHLRSELLKSHAFFWLFH